MCRRVGAFRPVPDSSPAGACVSAVGSPEGWPVADLLPERSAQEARTTLSTGRHVGRNQSAFRDPLLLAGSPDGVLLVVGGSPSRERRFPGGKRARCVSCCRSPPFRAESLAELHTDCCERCGVASRCIGSRSKLRSLVQPDDRPSGSCVAVQFVTRVWYVATSREPLLSWVFIAPSRFSSNTRPGTRSRQRRSVVELPLPLLMFSPGVEESAVRSPSAVFVELGWHLPG